MAYSDQIPKETFRASPSTEVEVRFLGNIDNRKIWRMFWELCDCGDGINREVLARILTRLSYMEGSRTRQNKRRELEKILRRVLDLKEELTRTFSTPINPHLGTIQELQTSAEWIGDDLTWWNKGRAKRGLDPKTPVLVSLMAYVRHATGDAHYRELSELVSAAYGISGSGRDCSDESLKMLWERNPDSRKNWKAVLGLSSRPTGRQKTHAPSRRRPLGSGPRSGFRPPEEHKSAVLGRKTAS
jgi:hypothetical protein